MLDFWPTASTPQPLRTGFAADATSDRLTAGVSYYGVLDPSVNLWEPVVTAANTAGRSFISTNLWMDSKRIKRKSP